MSLFSFFTGSAPNPQTDIQKGQEALTIFHNTMTSQFPDSYSLSYDELLDQVSATPDGTPQRDIFLDGMGTAITAINMTQGQIQDAMVNLANQSQGQLPKQSAFFKALSNRMSTLTASDWIQAAPQIALDTAATAVQGVQAVGDSLISTGKTLTMIGPALIVAAVIFIGYSWTRRVAAR